MVLAPDGSRVIVGGHFTTLNGTSAYGMGSLSTRHRRDPALGGEPDDPGRRQQRGDHHPAHRRHPDLRRRLRLRLRLQLRGHLRRQPDHRRHRLAQRLPRRHVRRVSRSGRCSTTSATPTTAPGSAASPRSARGSGSTRWPTPRTRPASTAARTTTAGTTTAGRRARCSRGIPTLGIGSYTGQYQAAWSITGNSNYVALGGEFPTANGVAQQGLVRYAVRALAPNQRGPQSSAAPDADRQLAVARPSGGDLAGDLGPGQHLADVQPAPRRRQHAGPHHHGGLEALDPADDELHRHRAGTRLATPTGCG